MYQHRGHGAASPIQLSFQNYPGGRTIRCGLEFLQVSHQADHFHEQVQIRLLLGRNIHEHRSSTPVFRHQAAVRQLLLYPIRQCVGLVDFVYCDNDWHFGCVGVVNGFERLRHHTIIGGHNQHNDVGGLGSARPHAGKRLMARCVEKYDLAAECRRLLVQDGYLVSANVLGDATGFASGHVGQSDGVEQRGLAVIYVAHDGNHRRTGYTLRRDTFLARGGLGNLLGSLLFEGNHIGIRSEESCHLAAQFGVKCLIDGGKHAASQQASDQILSPNSQLFCQVFDTDPFRNRNAARNWLRLV